MKKNKYVNPRTNVGEGNKNPFAEELGQNKQEDSAVSTEDSFTMGYGGEWLPFATGGLKRLSLLDNMETPGYSNREQGFGSPFSGMGETPLRDGIDYTKLTNFESMDLLSKRPDTKQTNKLNPLPQRSDGKKSILDELQTTAQISFRDKKLEATNQMFDFKKIAKKREKRLESIYSIDEDYSHYGRYCGKNTCVGVWKELLGHDQKKDLGISRESEVWRCPKCKEVTSATGSISEQTSGFSSLDNYSSGPVSSEDGFDAVNEIKEDKDRKKR